MGIRAQQLQEQFPLHQVQQLQMVLQLLAFTAVAEGTTTVKATLTLADSTTVEKQ